MNTSRRGFLQGLGGLGLTIPLWPRRDAGAELGLANAPRRLIVVYSPYGHPRDAWFPDDAARSAVQVNARAWRTALSDIEGDPSPVFTRATWGGLLDQALLLDGIDGGATIGHEKTMALTGWRAKSAEELGAPSVDQIIAQEAGLYPSSPEFPSLHAAVGYEGRTHSGRGISYAMQGSGVVVMPQIVDASTLWQSALRLLVVDGGEEAFEALRTRRLKIVDHVAASYRTLKDDARLSETERLRLEQYMQHLDELEGSVAAADYSGCEPTPEPDTGYATNAEHMAVQPQQMVDLLAQIIKCDVTRVVTFSLGASSLQFKNLGLAGEHHAYSHQYAQWEPDGALWDIARFHAQTVASLVAQLDEVEDHETGRTFLDNSLVVWTSDMGGVYNHGGLNMPVALFGAKGMIDQGAIMDFRSPDRTYGLDGRTGRIGVSYGGVLVAMCQAFGLEPSQFEYGQEGIGGYAYSNSMTSAYGGEEAYVAFAHGNKRDPLPEIFA